MSAIPGAVSSSSHAGSPTLAAAPQIMDAAIKSAASSETEIPQPDGIGLATAAAADFFNPVESAENGSSAQSSAHELARPVLDADNSIKAEPRSSSDAPPLPANLRRVLVEVAKTGSCSWLSWHTLSETTEKEGPAASLSSTVADTAAALALASNTASNSNSQGRKPFASAAGNGSHNSSNHNNSNSNPSATKYALGMAIPASRAQSRRPYTHNVNAAGAGVPKASRKKHRNGVKVSRRRMQDTTAAGGGGGGSTTQSGTTGGRKRPLFLIRTPATGGAAGSGGVGTVAQNVFSPGSVDSCRTSGSEPDDSTQYECDSEGTSATSCSELSTERRDNHLRNLQGRAALPAPKMPPSMSTDEIPSSPEDVHCLKDVFRMSLGLVLDHWYRQRGGYKLSPAEKRRSETVNADTIIPTAASSAGLQPPSSAAAPSTLVNGNNNNLHHPNGTNVAPDSNITSTASPDNKFLKQAPPDANKKISSVSTEYIFSQRRQRLLIMLGQTGDDKSGLNSSTTRPLGDGPPFTIQRIAEVLVSPERYYTQTHKLCNCLEKLLLVHSTSAAFGGSTGGITSQSRLEERELAALSDEKGRLESEFRQRALKRRHPAMSDDMQVDGNGIRLPGSPSNDRQGTDAIGNSSPEKTTENELAGPESSSREMLEAAARSLRTKFDHVGIDPHSSAVANRDVRSIADARGMTNSPPPPSLATAASNIALPGHTGVGNFVRQHLPESNAELPNIARVPSPILFSQGNESSPIAPLHAAPNIQLLHMHHAAPLSGTPFDVVTIQAGGVLASAPNSANSNEGADLEGRSSASNSDVDSESDDVSFDDSASDRSDGSDSGHYEPFTAARAMALNRIQQQQRLQSRHLTSLALHQSEGGAGFRPPADSEYQSGDSIDSTRGEDSGGSDCSSSSDVAD